MSSTATPAASPKTMTTTTTTTTAVGQSPDDAARFLHAVAVGGLLACPVLLLMPPRKLDLYTFAVGGLGVFCGNQLVRERNGGVGIMGLAGERLGFVRERQSASEAASSHARPGHESAVERFSLPTTERAGGLHEALAADREAALARRRTYTRLRQRADELGRSGWGVGGDLSLALAGATRRAAQDARKYDWPLPEVAGDDGKSPGNEAHGVDERDGYGGSGGGGGGGGEGGGGAKGLARRLWMGGETEGWKERRLQEEQQALDEGRGYGDLIMDQVWQVWNPDKRKDKDGNWIPKDGNEKD